MPADDGNPIGDFFVRWKKHVDYHIGSTLNGVLGLPSMVSRSYRAGDQVDSASATANNQGQSGSGCSRSNGRGKDDGARGTLPQDAVLMRQWYNWTVNSPYSPWNLQYIPQPVPNDLPGDMGFSPGGFADAFEDLLRASSPSSDGSMIDHHERADRFRTDRVAHRDIDPRVLWLAGLRADGLLGAAHPPATPGRELLGKPLVDVAASHSRFSSPTDVRIAWLDGLREQRWYNFYFPRQTTVAFRSPVGTFGWWSQEDWPAPGTEGSTSAAGDWKQEAVRVFKDALESARGSGEGGGGKNEAGRVSDELEERLYKMFGLNSDERKEPDDQQRRRADEFEKRWKKFWGDNNSSSKASSKVRNNDPQTEDDLLSSSIRSSTSDLDKSLNTLLKTASSSDKEQHHQAAQRNDDNWWNEVPRTNWAKQHQQEQQQHHQQRLQEHITQEHITQLEPGKRTSTETTRSPDGTTTVRTREERVDDKGDRRVKVVTRTYNANGDEISVQTENAVAWGWRGSLKWGMTGFEGEEDRLRWKQQQEQQQQQQQQQQKSGETPSDGGKKGGGSWFWK